MTPTPTTPAAAKPAFTADEVLRLIGQKEIEHFVTQRDAAQKLAQMEGNYRAALVRAEEEITRLKGENANLHKRLSAVASAAGPD